ncbi:hypothetical protein Avbf_13764 [Armadillidium vulgare]|nr:hypothetical protein Avbf_13764 [Armadillidium vulgare]
MEQLVRFFDSICSSNFVFTGNNELHETSPKLTSPYVRKFYWTKEELETIEGNDRELDTFNISVRENNLDNCLDNLKNSEDNC